MSFLEGIVSERHLTREDTPANTSSVFDRGAVERDRFTYLWRASGNIDKVVAVELDDVRMMVRRWATEAISVATDASGTAVSIKSEFGEEPVEQSVDLEAKPTTAVIDDLCIEVGKVKRDAITCVIAVGMSDDVEILERYAGDVCGDDSLQCVEISFDCRDFLEANSFTIAVCVHSRIEASFSSVLC
ncbi:hypothetical protein NGM29_10745 [Natronosalvus rutilus]|uniref:Uncharacterized protein n=1 Tax=Natronosalvus rutilus TaxID=2953753 RepID=A0A9E7STZ1_9EURY|nr:hypothetical protein [Natronosalvus rutilus]UTF52272.1 hypothetical protein NGM29_10745 [Natronosalvus rutilus]